MFASAEGAGGEIWCMLHAVTQKKTVFSRQLVLGKTGKAGSPVSRRECSRIAHSRPLVFARVFENKENRGVHTPRRHAEKLGSFQVTSAHKYLSTQQGLARCARRRRCFENAPESRVHKYVTFCAPPDTKENEIIIFAGVRLERRKFGPLYVQSVLQDATVDFDADAPLYRAKRPSGVLGSFGPLSVSVWRPLPPTAPTPLSGGSVDPSLGDVEPLRAMSTSRHSWK